MYKLNALIRTSKDVRNKLMPFICTFRVVMCNTSAGHLSRALGDNAQELRRLILQMEASQITRPGRRFLENLMEVSACMPNLVKLDYRIAVYKNSPLFCSTHRSQLVNSYHADFGLDHAQLHATGVP